MIAGHLQEKNGLYYIVLSYKDESGKRHTPWFPTKLPVKGNKKRAEAMLLDMRQTAIYDCKKHTGCGSSERSVIF